MKKFLILSAAFCALSVMGVRADEAKLVENVTFEGVGEDGAIHLTPKQMTGLFPIITPADADDQNVDVELIGAGEDRETVIASMYRVNYWDENNKRLRPYELSGHHVGECTLKVTSGDGNFTHEYPVIVEEPDRTPLENGYVDGTIILNEEWFGHTNGGLNYIKPDGELIYQAYERENPGMSFGATSQYATIWAGKFIACSKQAADGGDPLPGGGRVVVADAKTLKRIGSIDDLVWGEEKSSADARAVAGATPTKVYVGSTNGVYVVDLEKVEVIGKIGAIENVEADLYSGQMGDMVYAAGKVYAIKQSTGVYVIDTNLDQVVEFINAKAVQGITMSADGHVWYVETVDGNSNFVELDPATHKELSRHILSAEDYGTIVCSWGAWRNTQFVGCQTQNALWFSTGAGGIAGGGSGTYYRWDIDTEKVTLAADICEFEGSNARVKQKNYGTLRFDDRSGELIVMTCDNSASGHYRYNWYHFFDPETAELKYTITPRPYYWFQCFAIFPDKYAAEISVDDALSLNLDETKVYDLAEVITDADNIDANIEVVAEILTETVATEPEQTIAGRPSVVYVEAKDGKLSFSAIKAGTATVRLTAQSNGVITTKDIEVKVSDLSGIDSANLNGQSITCDGRRVVISGYCGTTFSLVNPAGIVMDTFTVDSDYYVLYPGINHGMYILSSKNVVSKLYIK